jgi:hypothetical protein
VPADRTLVIPINPPIKHEGGEVSELKLREPTGKEMREAERKFDGGVTPETLSNFNAALISAVSGVPEEALNKLPVSIEQKAVDYLRGFDVVPDQADNQPDTLEVDLPEPVSYGGVTYSSLNLREPTLGARRKAESAYRSGRTIAATRHYQILIVAAASDADFGAVENMPVSALNAAEAYLRGFLQPGRPTGSS